MSLTALVLVASAAFLGALTVRITGLGFALIAGPFFVLVLGPYQGVLLANLLITITCPLVWFKTYRKTELRKLPLLLVPALIMVALGARAAEHIPPAPLLITVGSLIVVGLVGVIVFERINANRLKWLNTKPGTIFIGAVSGLMNGSASVGGPALVAYKIGTKWGESFIPTTQVYFFFLNLVSLCFKELPSIDPTPCLGLICAVIAGTVIGDMCVGKIRKDLVHWTTATLAIIGGLWTIAKGFVLLT